MNLSQFLKVANWPMVVYLSLVHITAALGLYYISSIQRNTAIWTFVCYFFAGIGITGGAHRLWAHRSYSAHWTVRTLLMIFNSMASQDHRVHHKWSETPYDPHDANRGFFYAHMGWLLVKKDPRVIEAGKKINVDDLLNDPVVMFQKKLDPWWNLFWCFVFPALVPYYFWNESFLLGFLVAGSLRYACVLHATWTVNSIAHKYGDRPYDPQINPRENFWVALWALGEGWHNWHHKYPYDYATSEFGNFKNINPTKLFIDFFAVFGLVWDRKRALAAWEKAKSASVTGVSNVKNAAASLQSTAAY